MALMLETQFIVTGFTARFNNFDEDENAGFEYGVTDAYHVINPLFRDEDFHRLIPNPPYNHPLDTLTVLYKNYVHGFFQITCVVRARAGRVRGQVRYHRGPAYFLVFSSTTRWRVERDAPLGIMAYQNILGDTGVADNSGAAYWLNNELPDIASVMRFQAEQGVDVYRLLSSAANC